ncbi:putative RNA-binding protein RbpE [Smittium culicis]|uniref:Putative RNA-binding protein RbpE n=1 Tax=Smittium culicis TaxID=133412 RepID=A0A1R1XFE2_9FUNG|nr:putative RNA-binding protein RbpE [Smittium culicis]
MFSALRTSVSAASRFNLKALSSQQARDFCIKAVYVGNLPWSTQDTDVQKAFSMFGTIDSVHIPRFEDGRMKGYGFVRYIVGERPAEGTEGPLIPTVEEIDACTNIINNVVEKMNGVDFMGRTLRVSQTKSSANPQRNNEARDQQSFSSNNSYRRDNGSSDF